MENNHHAAAVQLCLIKILKISVLRDLVLQLFSAPYPITVSPIESTFRTINCKYLIALEKLSHYLLGLKTQTVTSVFRQRPAHLILLVGQAKNYQYIGLTIKPGKKLIFFSAIRANHQLLFQLRKTLHPLLDRTSALQTFFTPYLGRQVIPLFPIKKFHWSPI